jgi:uncharacterized membrane protein
MAARPSAMGLGFAYGAPAVLLGAYAWLRARHGLMERASAAGWAAAILGLVWLTLSIRASVDGPDMAGAPLSLNAHWALSIGWVLFAAALGAISVVLPLAGLKQASAALFVAALVKVFVIDLSPLDPVMRAFSTLLLGALGVGAAMLYQRFVFGRGEARGLRHRIDPNLMPPA